MTLSFETDVHFEANPFAWHPKRPNFPHGKFGLLGASERRMERAKPDEAELEKEVVLRFGADITVWGLVEQNQAHRHHRHTGNKAEDGKVVLAVAFGRREELVKRDVDHDAGDGRKDVAKHVIGEEGG